MTEAIFLGALIAAAAAAWWFLRVRKAPAGWHVGPIVRGESRSPRATIAGNVVTIPHGTVGDRIGELSGLVKRCGPLSGVIRARFRIEGADLLPSQPGYSTPTATLFFQRKGDDWSGRGEREAYRWYAAFATQVIGPGEFTLEASLDDPRWTAVLRSTAESNPSGFADAKANAESVGFVFGGGDGYAHGLYATGPARLVLLEFVP